jgi:hypothetical protein
MMYAIVESFAQLVATPPEPVVTASRVGARKPSTPGDLPAMVISLSIDDQRTSGLGRTLRSGELVTRTSAIVEVSVTPDTFSADLRHLRLSPLPLKQNPASIKGAFTAGDVQVTNVSDAAHPVAYRFARQPAEQQEFTIDAAQARLTFGRSQTSGDKLEVVHWTVTWRDDIEGVAYRGLMNVDVWAERLGEVTTASQKLQDRLASQHMLMRQFGFSKLQAAGLVAAEHVLHTPPVGSPFQVWRQSLTYRFAFEVERPAQDSSAGPIRRIDVEIDGNIDESLEILRPTS